ncbi:MAG TPA: hypothetical protein VKY53_04720 [Marinobacter sp.]|nr:hypothetical protein [Marinobacter sp.]
MKPSVSISGEHIDHKVAAIFDSESAASEIVRALAKNTTLADDQILLVRPTDRHPGVELEPEDQGIWRTMVRSHITLGVLGVVAGFVFFLILTAFGLPFVTQNAITSAVVFSAFGGIFGLLLAGAFTARPDHMPYLMKAQSALRKGKFVVTVHATSAHQLEEATQFLESRNTRLVRSL